MEHYKVPKLVGRLKKVQNMEERRAVYDWCRFGVEVVLYDGSGGLGTHQKKETMD